MALIVLIQCLTDSHQEIPSVPVSPTMNRSAEIIEADYLIANVGTPT